MKKLIAWFLILLLVCTVSVYAAAEDAAASSGSPIASGDYSYIVLEDETVEIRGYHGREETLVIPDELEGRLPASENPLLPGISA